MYFNLVNIPTERATFPSNILMCCLKLRSLSIITPRYLALSTIFTGDPLLIKKRFGGIVTLVCFGGIIMTLVLVGLMESLFTQHH